MFLSHSMLLDLLLELQRFSKLSYSERQAQYWLWLSPQIKDCSPPRCQNSFITNVATVCIKNSLKHRRLRFAITTQKTKHIAHLERRVYSKEQPNTILAIQIQTRQIRMLLYKIRVLNHSLLFDYALGKKQQQF